MATETTTVFHARRQRRMCIVGVFVDVTCEAAPTPVPRHVDRIANLRLAEVAARALFPQYRVGNAVAQRLEVRIPVGTRRIIENGTRFLHDTAASLHQVARDPAYPVGMTRSAGTFCRCEVARERDHSLVRECLCRYLRVARVTGDTVLGRESVGRIETALLRGVAL